MVDVPFTREIHEGMVGADVIGHKRAISRWNPRVYPWPRDGFSPLAGPFLMEAVVKFKVQHNLGARRVLGTQAHEQLEKAVAHYAHVGEPAFDAKAIELCQSYYDQHHTTPEQRIRAAIKDAAFYWYEHRLSIAYSQYRPYPVVKPPTVPPHFDCSGFVTASYFAGGAHDPNGRGFDGQGYTGTLVSHGTRVRDVASLKLGDLLLYGYSSGFGPAFSVGDPTHVAVYVGVIGNVPSVLSMGHFPLSLFPWNYRGVNQMRTYAVV